MTEIFLGGQCKQYLSRSFAVANVFIFAFPATQPPEEIMMILLVFLFLVVVVGVFIPVVDGSAVEWRRGGVEWSGVNSKQGNLV